MKKILLFLFLLVCSVFIGNFTESNYKDVTMDDVYFVDVTFDYYDFYETYTDRIITKNDFVFLDYTRLPICYTAIGDFDAFKETFFNIESGTKMHIGYLKSNLEIIEIKVNDTEYLMFEESIERFKLHEKHSFFMSLLFAPIVFVGIHFVLLLANIADIPQE